LNEAFCKEAAMAGTLTKFSKAMGQISSKTSNFVAPARLSQRRSCKYIVLLLTAVNVIHATASPNNDFCEHLEALIW
jgi:hypothetical protein